MVRRRIGVLGALGVALFVANAHAEAPADYAVGAWDTESGELLWMQEPGCSSDATVTLYSEVLVIRSADEELCLNRATGDPVDPPGDLGAPIIETEIGAEFFPIVDDGIAYGLLDGPSNTPAGPPKPPSPDDPNKKHDDDCNCSVPGSDTGSFPTSAWLVAIGVAVATIRKRRRE